VLHSARSAGAEWIIESFNGRLRDEYLNVECFVSMEDARHKLAQFRKHYNEQGPHHAMADRTPAAFAALRQGKASHLLGRAFQSLLIESLDCAKPSANQANRTVEGQNL
jgi:Integrase core domain